MSSRGRYRGGSRGGGGGYRGGSNYNNRGNSSRSTYNNSSSTSGGDRYGNGYDNYDSRGSTSRSSYQNSSSGDRYRDSYKRSSSGYDGHSRDHRTPDRKRSRNDYQDSRRSGNDNYGGGYSRSTNHYESSSSFDHHNTKRHDNRSSRNRSSAVASSSSSKYRRDNSSSSSRRSRERMGPPPPPRSTNVRRPFRGRPLNSRGTVRPNRSSFNHNDARSTYIRKRYLAATPRSREMLRKLRLARIKSLNSRNIRQRGAFGAKPLSSRNGKASKKDGDTDKGADNDTKPRKSSSSSPKKKVSSTKVKSTAADKDGSDGAAATTTTENEKHGDDVDGDEKKVKNEDDDEEVKKTPSKANAEKTVSEGDTEAVDGEKSSKADESEGKDRSSKSKRRSSSKRDDKESSSLPKSRYTGKTFMKLTCVHCKVSCVTFKEYIKHLQKRQHNQEIRIVSKRQKRTLQTMRIEQRQAQRELEGDDVDKNAVTLFCMLCRLNYRQPKADHQKSEGHKNMKKFLMPYCRVCQIGFKSPIAYEVHRCSLEHIKKKAWRSTKSDSGGEEANEKDIDLENFMTVDSVGDVDDGADKSATEIEPENDKDVNVGSEHVKKIETFYCDLCRYYLPHHEDPDASLKRHCRNRSHLKAYLQHKEDRSLRKAAEIEHRRRQDKKDSSTSKEKGSDDKKETDEHASKSVPDDETATKVDAENDDNVDVKIEVEKNSKAATPAIDGNDEKKKGKESQSEKEPEGGDEKMFEDVDKDLGELLTSLLPDAPENDDDDEEDSRMNNERYDRFKTGEKTSSDEHEPIDEEDGPAEKVENGN